MTYYDRLMIYKEFHHLYMLMTDYGERERVRERERQIYIYKHTLHTLTCFYVNDILWRERERVRERERDIYIYTQTYITYIDMLLQMFGE